ncbi:Predicted dehydrogenase [Verrucomicrobium sp. GAS474]|uniref:Gfo/Idh/MocA family protein n=1 Tax=Verrucomicrobium sp. GAS474 TaxID=1882831 RepID=UPI00087AA96A|nr:Gfo/Idh/MocA family oxidoreductase [Verrucomicrobium sp. GAS474]SDU14518.1 Predicted dehydrogenase [Verrucomicrobium sp. GAS474]
MSSTPRRIPIGIIGCGHGTGAFFSSLRRFPTIQAVACADSDFFRAENRAQQYSQGQATMKACSIDELLADKGISLVVNLAPARSRAGISLRILEAKKHLFSDSPLSLDLAEAAHLLEEAERRNLRIGSAPDLFLGAPLQTALALINEGSLGIPLSAHAHLSLPAPETWHPDPESFYLAGNGGGPLFDAVPPLLSALVTLLGPVAAVIGSTRTPLTERTVTSEKKQGVRIPVEVPTHVTALLDFATGAGGTLTASYDVLHHRQPALEIHGTEGSLSLATFEQGPVSLRSKDDPLWREIPPAYAEPAQSPGGIGKGIGLGDMAAALLMDKPHRASAPLALHLLDALLTLARSSEEGIRLAVGTSCSRPAPLPAGIAPGELVV